MWGSHLIKAWSTIHTVVSSSSCEADSYGMVNGACVRIGFQAVLKALNIECSIVLKSDASAAIAIASLHGLGKVRHIEVANFGEKVRPGDIKLVKVDIHWK